MLIGKIKVRQLLASLLVAVFVLTPLQLDVFVWQIVKASETYDTITEDTIISGEYHIYRGLVVDNGAVLTIEKGSHLIFHENGDEGSYLLIGSGRLIANGAQDGKIIFSAATGENPHFYLGFMMLPEDGLSFLRYVEIRGGGRIYDDGTVSHQKNKLFSTAFAADAQGLPALRYYSGKVHIENTLFDGNSYADIGADAYFEEGYNEGDFFEVVNSNFENNSNNVALISNVDCRMGNCKSKILLKNNWYGNTLGPRTNVEVVSDGEEVRGIYQLDGWRMNKLIADPVVVVPGIMGSEKFLGNWKLDPITHVYDDLIDSLKSNGYEKNINLFEFPYDWRLNNETTAHYLQARIEGIINASKVSKVDVVAHSMGGLVARAYIEEVGGALYENTIDQLVTLGTPHGGSPEAYLKWEAGEGFFRWQGVLAKHHFKQEAEHAGYDDLYKYIQEKVTSVRELLPDYSYLSGGSLLREYPNDYPCNTFLEELNESKNVSKMSKVDHTNIVGITDIENTISKIRVTDSTVEGKWLNGMPENFYNEESDRGLENSKGDETVPVKSAKSVAGNKTIEINASHQELPGKAQCEVFKELTGLANCKYDLDWHMANLLLFNVFSPIDIQIVSPSGKRIGKNFTTGEFINEIDRAYYSGNDSENEFVTILNPENGEYKILTQGTGSGNYRIEAVKILNDGNDPGNESTVVLSGKTNLNEINELKVEAKESVIIDKNAVPGTPPSPPIIPAPVIITSVNNVGGDISNTSVQKKAKHKKKKSKKKKKTKKIKQPKVVKQKKKVLGVSKAVPVKQKRIISKVKRTISTKSVPVFQKAEKAMDSLKGWILKPFEFFKNK